MHKMTESPQRSRMPGDREMVFMMAMVMALNALAIDSMLPALPAIGEGLGVVTPNDGSATSWHRSSSTPGST